MPELISHLISVVVTFHNEELLAHKTLLGLERLRRFANQRNIEVEFVLVLDSADGETTRVVRSSPVLRDGDQILAVTNQDLGASRNSGIAAAHGNWIGIFDGDDYYSENWLVVALDTLNSKQGEVVVHPDFSVSFGGLHLISQSLDLDRTPNYPLANCLSAHPWTSSVFAKRETYLRHPYLRTDSQKTGFGFEDWHWNLEVLAEGVRHVSAPNTALFYRRKSSSLLVDQTNDNAIVRPSKFFDTSEKWSDTGIYSDKSLSDSCPEISVKRFIISLIRPIWQRVFHILPRKLELHIRKLVQAQVIRIPEWIINELRSLSKIEFNLYPAPNFLYSFDSYTTPIVLEIGKAYQVCCSIIGDLQPDIIFVIPWLVPGGADRGVLHHVNAALAADKNVLVISTLNEESPWKKRLPKQVKFLEFNDIGRTLSESQKLSVLTRIVIQSPAKVIHIIHSALGWEMLRQYGKSLLALDKQIFASLYCDDYHHNGVPWSFAQNFVDCWKFLQGVMCDTHWYPQDLVRQYGVSLDKIYTVYFPVIFKEPPIYRAASTPRILWAGRFTQQKRIDLLIKIARLLPNVVFDVYGHTTYKEEYNLECEMRKLSNIKVHGEFDSLESVVAKNSYSLFLYTSAWDGLPNILLEATLAGLPVVASAVCGVPEFISEETGYPVLEVNDPRAYAQRISEALAGDVERRRRWEAAVALIMSRHTEDYFALQLKQIPGYFSDQ